MKKTIVLILILMFTLNVNSQTSKDSVVEKLLKKQIGLEQDMDSLEQSLEKTKTF